jgi:predicted RNase H-like HicB family nuclease
MRGTSYAIVLEAEPDGSAINVSVPAFPEAHTWGATLAEAIQNAREVVELCLEERLERGEPIPPADGDRIQ